MYQPDAGSPTPRPDGAAVRLALATLGAVFTLGALVGWAVATLTRI